MNSIEIECTDHDWFHYLGPARVNGYKSNKHKSNKHKSNKPTTTILPLDATHSEAICEGDSILIPINNKNTPVINTLLYSCYPPVIIKYHGRPLIMNFRLNPSREFDIRFKKISADPVLSDSIKCINYSTNELVVLEIMYT